MYTSTLQAISYLNSQTGDLNSSHKQFGKQWGPRSMSHCAAFHQGLHYLFSQTIFRDRNTIYFFRKPLNIHSLASWLYCMHFALWKKDSIDSKGVNWLNIPFSKKVWVEIQRKKYNILGNYNLWPLNIYTGPFWRYYKKLFGKFYWSGKG